MAPQVCECSSEYVTSTTMNTTETLSNVSPFIFPDSPKSELRLAHDEAISTDAGKEDAACHSEATTAFDTPPLREKGPDMSKALHALDEATSTDGGNECVPFGTAFSSQVIFPEDSETTTGNSGVYPKMLLLQLRCTMLGCPQEASSPAAVSVNRAPAAHTSALNYSIRHIADIPFMPDSSEALLEAGPAARHEWVPTCLSKLSGDSLCIVFEELISRLTHPEHITGLVREVFDKATSQHHGVPLYAELCVRLAADPSVLALCEPPGEKAFRRILLNECQLRFQEMNCRRQARGLMKFIGELLVRGMLGPKLLVEIAEELLRSWEVCVEAAFEPLVTLLVVAGPQFDTPTYRYYSRLLGIFASMDELTKNESTPEAMRMLLHSVLELRNSGWSSKIRRTKC